MKILQINSSVRGEASTSTKLATEIVQHLKGLRPEAIVEVRDLSEHQILDAKALQAHFTPADARSEEQRARVALDDAAIAQLTESDIVVLGVPLYNLGEPVQLKAWIDSITRAGVTFRYTPDGPEGLVKGKKVFVAFSRGGRYKGTPFDTQTPYLRNFFGFLGMTDVTFLHAEGLAMGEEAAAQAMSQVHAEIEALAL